MKTILFAGLLGCITVAAAGADEGFTKSVPPADLAAAGLTKLTVGELAKLDQLVQDYKSGTVEAARREAAAAAEARVVKAEAEAQETKAAAAPVKKADGGLWEKARVLVTPGTNVEYSTIESRLARDFTGWEPDQIFTLENGQRWKVDHYADEYVTSRVEHPPVQIAPGSMGGFWLKFPGLGIQVKVKLLK